MAAEQEGFLQLLTTLLSTDNTVRTRAEETYSNLPVEYKVTHLLAAVQATNIGEDGRQMAAVLLRRLLTNDFHDFYPKLPTASQEQLKNQMIMAVQRDQPACTRRKICELIAEMARNMIDEEGNNTWPEFLQFLFQLANAPSSQLQESALRIFAAVPGVFGNQQTNYLDLIKQMLRQSLTQEDFDVRMQAVKAIGAFILLHDKEMPILKHFTDLLPNILEITLDSIEKHDDDCLVKVLIELAESTPKFLRPQLPQVFDVAMKIFSNPAMLDSWRHMALEVMVTLSETAPSMVRKLANKYITALIPLMLNMMTDIDEDNDWGACDEIAEDESDCNNSVAESSLDRIACGLGGKIILPLVVQNIPAMLGNPDWKHRHAALMAISVVGEGCHKQMEDMLPSIMDAVVQYLQDPHPRVRYAACNAIGQMSTDFAPVFEKKFHDRVIPGLLMVLDDNENPRVQAHAGAALVNFSEDCPKYILTQYLDSIMSKLEAILSAKFKELVEKGTKLVIEQVVTTIASVADTSEKEFVAYYDRLMPCLKYIIQNANTEELRMLRGKTIECVSLIGLAVGAEKFMHDANEIMDLLLKTQTEDLPDDDPQTSYLISAWSRICKVLGKQFEQYLPLVMGPVLRAASMKPEVALLDNDDMQNVEDVDWQFVSLGEQQNFGIKTAGLEDKANACIMLVTYARELKEGFAEYAEEVVKLMIPMLKFYFHDGVRSAAAESLPYLLDCAKIKGPQYLQGMWQYICPELLKSVETEPESEVLLEMMFSLARCIETLGNGCLSEQAMAELLRILDKMLKDHFERAQNRLKKHLDEDYDDVVEEQLEDEENDDIFFLSKIGDVMHALLMTYKADFLPYFDQICGHFVQLLEPNRPWSDRQWGLCTFDDVIEYTGPACIKYQHIFLQPLAAYIGDRSPEVRQAAAYGWGLLAQYGGEHFGPELEKALPLLINIINDVDSRAAKNINCTENAISAVTKILKYRSSQLKHVDDLILMWLGWLPVVEDDDEAPHVYGYLCDLIESNHPLALGANNQNLPRLVSIICEAFYKLVKPTQPVGIRMANIVRQIQANDTMFQTCLAVLSPELKQALHNALQTPPVAN